jgi:hypothetical protein
MRSDDKTSTLSWKRTVGAKSELWDIRQPVSTLIEDIVRILYQKTTSEDIRIYVCCIYNDL